MLQELCTIDPKHILLHCSYPRHSAKACVKRTCHSTDFP